MFKLYYKYLNLIIKNREENNKKSKENDLFD